MKCSDCKSRKYCDNADKVKYCAGYIFDDSKPKMQTNEEWLRNASTEELAEWLALADDSNRKYLAKNIAYWKKWLKEKHNGN